MYLASVVVTSAAIGGSTVWVITLVDNMRQRKRRAHRVRKLMENYFSHYGK